LPHKEAIEQKVEAMVLPLLEGTSIELADVEYVREGGWFLRVFLDKPGGLEVDDCQTVSERLGKLLDEQDFIKTRYYLEVSSPGLDRKLRRERDFVKYAGALVDVEMKDSKQPNVGRLGACSPEHIELASDGRVERLERALIRSIRLHVDF